tara:strand:- start:65 stop:1087 length:1023 start_codon:yes stop_codon:yes gene_type:complete
MSKIIKRPSLDQQIDRARDGEVLGKGVRTRDEYLKELRDTKQNIKNEVIKFAVLVKSILNNNLITQSELADEMGMHKSTISRWVSVGNHRMVRQYRDNLPMSLEALYTLTTLEKEYIHRFNESVGKKKFDSLFDNQIVNNETTSGDVYDLVQIHRKKVRQQKKKETERLFQESDTKELEYENKVYNIQTLTNTKKWFNTIVLIPTVEQLKRWNDLGMSSYIEEDFPITQLRNTTHTSTITFLMKVQVKFLDIGLKCLNAWGFTYRDTYLPKQTKESYESGKNEYVIIRGERGIKPKGDEPLSIKSLETKDIMSYAEQIGNKPYVIIGEEQDDENWTICIG